MTPELMFEMQEKLLEKVNEAIASGTAAVAQNQIQNPEGPQATAGSTLAVVGGVDRKIMLTRSQLQFLKETIERAVTSCDHCGGACDELRRQFEAEKRVLRSAVDIIDQMARGN